MDGWIWQMSLNLVYLGGATKFAYSWRISCGMVCWSWEFASNFLQDVTDSGSRIIDHDGNRLSWNQSG